MRMQKATVDASSKRSELECRQKHLCEVPAMLGFWGPRQPNHFEPGGFPTIKPG
jgi:hypothetical protein